MQAGLCSAAIAVLSRADAPVSKNAASGCRRVGMQDAFMLLFTVVFFAVAFLYVKACQKLR